jgi:hypothetical protein
MSFTTFCPYRLRGFLHDIKLKGQRRAFADHVRSRELLSHAVPKNRLKNPNRGGRNIRDRYLVLEKSLRGKETLIKGRDEQTLTGSAPTNSDLNHASSAVSRFRGFVIPTEPSPPQSDGMTYNVASFSFLTCDST